MDDGHLQSKTVLGITYHRTWRRKMKCMHGVLGIQEKFTVEDSAFAYTNYIELGNAGGAYYDGDVETDPLVEARLWVESILNETESVVKR